jgi:hypothetical protein
MVVVAVITKHLVPVVKAFGVVFVAADREQIPVFN